VAALRFAAMSRPSASEELPAESGTPWHLGQAWVDPKTFDEERARFHREHVARMDSGEGLRRRTERV
jgi:hypothetical protein